MEELLMQLAKIARSERSVATDQLGNGMVMLVYPEDDAVIVGIGYEGELAQKLQPDDLLRRRSENLELFGAWLPAMFKDGSIYVVRRVADLDFDSGNPILLEDELAAAEALLA